MAVPGSVSNFIAQQANGQGFVSWSITATATTYSVQRSLDGVTYSVVGTPATNYYLDTAVTVGTLYYYRVAGVNIDGTGAYTTAQSVVPTYSGSLSLGEVRLLAQQRSDMINSTFITTAEWNSYINQSYFELYDLLVTVFEDYFLAPVVSFTTDGTNASYALPNGLNYSAARPFYKLLGVDCGLPTSTNAFVTLQKFNFISRNKYVYPQISSSILGVFNPQYRVMGSNITFIPTPSSGQTMRLWYIPRVVELLLDTDILDGISGWTEYVICDAAIKAMIKEEDDVSALMAQKAALKQRIEESASNRDAGSPDTISNTRTFSNLNGVYGDPSGFGGGSWGGY